MKSAIAPATSECAERTRKRVLIVDDHPVFRQGLKSVLGQSDEFEICGDAESAASAIEAFRLRRPDIIIVDVSLPGVNGIELIKMIVAEAPKSRILVVSMHDETLYALRALKAGARGYVMKGDAMDSIVAALRTVATGRTYVSPAFGELLIFKAIQSLEEGLGSPVDILSDRELEVLEKMGKGMSTRAIADHLHLSPKTVETHRAHIKEKLNFKDATTMVRFAVEWVASDDPRLRPSRVAEEPPGEAGPGAPAS
jgi:DNA-binding NarL/FixJ family response regulator